jgi:hypothetical protein
MLLQAPGTGNLWPRTRILYQAKLKENSTGKAKILPFQVISVATSD